MDFFKLYYIFILLLFAHVDIITGSNEQSTLDKDDQDMASSNSKKGIRSSIPDDVYQKLEEILKSKMTFSDWPKKEQPSLRQKVYRKWKSGHYELKDIYEPRQGCKVTKIVEKRTGKIVLRKSEVEGLVEIFYKETKGEGARKIRKNMQNLYSGVAEKRVHKALNKMKDQQNLRPLFKNKAPLRPIQAKNVQERNQIDLVDMSSLSLTSDGKTYKYILSVIDIFSRYLHLRPLETKDSGVVAQELVNIYCDHGVPDILQSDQGGEFKGTVQKICKVMGVKIIRSSAYNPTTQGKDERSHRTWKEKLRFDLMNCKEDGVNWVENLPIYQQLYNESPHRSLGLACPFEVYYGRKPNRLKNRSIINSNSNICDVDVEEEIPSGDFEFNEDLLSEDIKQWKQVQELIRNKAAEASEKAAQNMIKRNLRKLPPSTYDIGETVLVRVVKKSAAKKTGKKLVIKTHAEGKIVKTDHKKHRYHITYTDPNTGKQQTKWFSVNDVTSLTIEEESKKQKKAEEKVKSSQKHKLEVEDEKCTKKVKFSNETRRESILDKAITEIIEVKKLTSDTVNLYTGFVTEVYPFSDVVIASTFCYPSLDRVTQKDETFTYRKYISNKTLGSDVEKIIIPVHLQELEHWLLAAVCILKLSITLYDSIELSEEHYASIFAKLKSKFIAKEQNNSEEDLNTKNTLNPDNWTENVVKETPKQINDSDCGVFMCLNIKMLCQSHFSTKKTLEGNESAKIRDEMAKDLLKYLPTLVSPPHSDYWILPELFGMKDNEADNKDMLDQQVHEAGCRYRGEIPMDGNCFFHVVSDQLNRLNLPAQSHTSLRENVVAYIKEHPKTPDGTHYSEFITNYSWKTYLMRMARDGVWADWVVVWAMANMLNCDIAIISSTGSSGLRVITPHTTGDVISNKKNDGVILLAHLAESHYFSIEPAGQTTTATTEPSSDVFTEMSAKYGQGEVTEMNCPKCNKKFQCYSSGVYELGRSLVCYSDDQEFCDDCELDIRYQNPGMYSEYD